MMPFSKWVLLSLFLGLAGLPLDVQAQTRARQPKSYDGTVKVWETTTDQLNLLSPQADLQFHKAGRAEVLIGVDDRQTYQTMTGFGAAMTDASAHVLNHHLSASQREGLMTDLFSPSQGIGLSFVRLTIGASDFSSHHYSYDDMPTGQTDPTLAHFSIEPARAEVVPLIRQAKALNGQLTVMATPWSAPGWMKSSDSLIKGTLNPSAYPYFSAYLAKYLRAMREEGVTISLLSLQNEPSFEPNNYPGMLVPPSIRAAFIGKFLGPTLKAEGFATQILDYDHNWDLPSSPLAVLHDDVARSFVSGVAWHCYAGDVSAQGPVHDAYPDKDAYFTECSGGEWAADFGTNLDWFVKTLIIGSTRNWAKGVVVWNLALDEHHGPHLGGCSDCRGVITINSVTGEVTRNLEYYALGHASAFVQVGATRIASDTQVNGIETVAFRNPKNGSIVLILVNTRVQAQDFAVQWRGKQFSHRIPAGAVATYVWQM